MNQHRHTMSNCNKARERENGSICPAETLNRKCRFTKHSIPLKWKDSNFLSKKWNFTVMAEEKHAYVCRLVGCLVGM